MLGIYKLLKEFHRIFYSLFTILIPEIEKKLQFFGHNKQPGLIAELKKIQRCLKL